MHRIRLREPWVAETQTPLTFNRSFNSPTGLSAEQSVQLVVECQPGVAVQSIHLNGQPLPIPADTTSNCSIEIHELLSPHNRLQLSLIATAGSAGAHATHGHASSGLGELAQVHLAIAEAP